METRESLRRSLKYLALAGVIGLGGFIILEAMDTWVIGSIDMKGVADVEEWNARLEQMRRAISLTGTVLTLYSLALGPLSVLFLVRAFAYGTDALFIQPLRDALHLGTPLVSSRPRYSAASMRHPSVDSLIDSASRGFLTEDGDSGLQSSELVIPSITVLPELTGQTLGPYVLLQELGRGGMAAVYLSRDPRAGDPVAIKVLDPRLASDPDYVQRFAREARVIRGLNHPNIVRAHGAAHHQGFYYIVMEYVQAVTLAQLITQEGRLEWKRALGIIRQVALALGEAHRNGIIHRDIKPHNILVQANDAVKLTDFGLARDLNQTTVLTAQGAKPGTLLYMSPEQCQGAPVDGRTDIYSLGVTLFECLTGKPPVEPAHELAVMYQIIHNPLMSVHFLNPTVPQVVERLVQDMTAKDPAERVADCGSLIQRMDVLEREHRKSLRQRFIRNVLGSVFDFFRVPLWPPSRALLIRLVIYGLVLAYIALFVRANWDILFNFPKEMGI